MELMFEIEETLLEADTLNSLLQAVTEAAYSGSLGFGYFETAFGHICNLADGHSKRLKQLTDEAFALSHDQKTKVLHMQAGRG